MKRRLIQILLSGLLAFFTLASPAVERVIYYHNDALGSPIAATDEQGKVIWREEYTPYGERLLGQATEREHLGYTGKPEEAALGLTYFGARWYDPHLGRFLSPDPVPFQETNPHSFNRYAYGNANPYKYVDPDGNSPLLIVPLVMGGSAIISGAINAYIQHETTGTVRWQGIGGVLDAAGDGALLGIVGGSAALGARATTAEAGAVNVTKGVATPHGLAVQADSAAARAALQEVQSGATVYRQGSFGIQNTTDAQFWSIQNPAVTQGFANRMGMPGGAAKPDWIMGGTVRPGSPVVTRPAPGIGSNLGGDIEAVVPLGGVQNRWFHMPD